MITPVFYRPDVYVDFIHCFIIKPDGQYYAFYAGDSRDKRVVGLPEDYNEFNN